MTSYLESIRVSLCLEDDAGTSYWYSRKSRTAWPRDRGLISRNAKTLSDSNSLNEGISPMGKIR